MASKEQLSLGSLQNLLSSVLLAALPAASKGQQKLTASFRKKLSSFSFQQSFWPLQNAFAGVLPVVANPSLLRTVPPAGGGQAGSEGRGSGQRQRQRLLLELLLKCCCCRLWRLSWSRDCVAVSSFRHSRRRRRRRQRSSNNIFFQVYCSVHSLLLFVAAAARSARVPRVVCNAFWRAQFEILFALQTINVSFLMHVVFKCVCRCVCGVCVTI